MDLQNFNMTNEEIQKMRFQGVAPEGYVLVSEKALEKLKDFYVWKQWIHNEVTLKDLEEYENI